MQHIDVLKMPWLLAFANPLFFENIPVKLTCYILLSMILVGSSMKVLCMSHKFC